MGFFNLFKKKPVVDGFDEKIFDTKQFKMEAMAFAMVRLAEAKGNYDIAKQRLISEINLNEKQAGIIVDMLKRFNERDRVTKNVQELLDKGQTREALEYSLQMYEENSDEVTFLEIFIDVALIAKPAEEVLELLDRLEAKHTNQAYNIKYRKALTLKQLKRYDEAMSLFSELNDIEPFAWNYYQIGIIKNLLGDTASCLSYLEKAFELDPELKADAKGFPELNNLYGNRTFRELVYN